MSNFKKGDRVYHFQHGWGEVIKPVFECDVLVRYETENLIGDNFQIQVVERMLRFDFLSFTEYTLQGFSQERPVELPEIGELCLVRDDESIHWRVREFAFEHNGTFYVKEPCGSTDGYVYMKRIKILD
jgi:hypothetical protein